MSLETRTKSIVGYLAILMMAVTFLASTTSSSQSTPQLRIRAAEVDCEFGTIILRGQFQSPETVVVSLDLGDPAGPVVLSPVGAPTFETIVVGLPTCDPPGTYRLEVGRLADDDDDDDESEDDEGERPVQFYTALDVTLGAVGPQGVQGPPGSAGAPGAACWDLNADLSCDTATEDLDQDGQCTVADCQGPAGPQGPPGNLALANMSCPPDSFVTGFDASGNILCSGDVVPPGPVCGNGVVETGEQCDDGNLVDGDGCSATCTLETPPGDDADGDGWTIADGDCCDDTTGCANPALVNPGAFEILGNSVDDDCDAATDDVTPVACSTLAKVSGVSAMDLVQAMDLCQQTTASEPLPTRKWGVLSADLLLASGSAPSAAQLSNMTNTQTAVLADYGVNGPANGSTMAGLSSGAMRDAGDPGFVPPSPGSDLGSTDSPPADFLAANGGSLPASTSCDGSCPSGSGAYDPVNLRMTIRVPTNAVALNYKFRFFSAEYGFSTCSIYNDSHLALLGSTAPGIPADKNIAFDANGDPVSNNSGFYEVCSPQGCHTCPLGTGDLVGTGMDTAGGGGTGWLTASAPVVPGETIELRLMIFDVSDGSTDSLVLLDEFEWTAASGSP